MYAYRLTDEANADLRTLEYEWNYWAGELKGVTLANPATMKVN